jgi:superfamily II DNA/RNA helicase
MDAFHSGKATTLVATDIAARGIHVDDVALVIHADPPAEHKAYLHRSGRTARAGAAGTVITLMTDQQVRDVRDLTRAAGIKPTTTRVSGPNHEILQELAPGERVLVAGGLGLAEVPSGNGGGGRSGRSGRSQDRSQGRPQGGGGNRKRGGRGGAKAAPQAASGESSGRPRRARSGRPQSASGGSGHSAASFSGARRGR